MPGAAIEEWGCPAEQNKVFADSATKAAIEEVKAHPDSGPPRELAIE